MSAGGHAVNSMIRRVWFRTCPIVTKFVRYNSVRIRSPGEVDVFLSNGRNFRFTTGRLARMADGSCVGKSGDTNVMVTVVSNRIPSLGGIVPLTVDYRQKAAAAGRIPTNYLRREVGTSEKEILTSRVIDRSLRPLFKEGYLFETQIICNLLSVDGVHDPEVVAINSASAALCVSDIPWDEPVGAIRVCVVKGTQDVIVNPTRKELSDSSLEMMVSGTENKKIVMIEASTREESDFNMVQKCLAKATKEIAGICRGLKALSSSVKKEVRPIERYYVPQPHHLELLQEFASDVKSIFMNGNHTKKSRDVLLQEIRKNAMDKLSSTFPGEEKVVFESAFYKMLKEWYKDVVFSTGKRSDGRGWDELRPISCDVNMYEALHGSAIFQRGQTQVLCTVALDSLSSAFRNDPVSMLLTGVKEKNFMLHYEFPPFATNETGRASSFGRRELGHGALAEKSLRPLIPEKFPFTIRLSCDVLESNGSSSMASVCAGSLALMDAGVAIEKHTAGVAMGCLTKGGEVAILTDISGIEDYLGEMDFKMAGTKKGFTGIQLDVKGPGGVDYDVVHKALLQGIEAKSEIIKIMHAKINIPHSAKKEQWPISTTLEVPVHKRTRFFGLGGSNLKRLAVETGVQINQDPSDPNVFTVFAPNQDAMKEAQEVIDSILQDDPSVPTIDFGSIVTSKILEIKDNGLILSLHPKMDPVFIHIKELDQRKIEHTSVLNLKVGDELQVKYFGRDPVSGQVRVSRRILQITSSRTIKPPKENESIVDEKEN